MLLKSKTQIWFVFLTLKFLVFSTYWFLVSKNFIHQLFLLDDLGYLKLYQSHENEWSWNLSQIQAIAGGQNSFYYIIIHLAFEYLGRTYFHVVLLNNIIYTLAIAFLSKKFTNIELILLLCFPSVLLWTTMFNIKMALVLALLLIVFKVKTNFTGIIFITLSLVVLANIRFYLSFFVLLSFLLYVLGANKRILLFIGSSFGLIFPYVLGYVIPDWDFTSLFSENYFVGIFRFLVTPLPWTVEQEYSFLLISFLFEWLLVLRFTWHIFKQDKILPIEIMILLMIFFYGLVYELQGPRHRVVVELLMIMAIYGRKKVVFTRIGNLRGG